MASASSPHTPDSPRSAPPTPRGEDASPIESGAESPNDGNLATIAGKLKLHGNARRRSVPREDPVGGMDASVSGSVDNVVLGALPRPALSLTRSDARPLASTLLSSGSVPEVTPEDVRAAFTPVYRMRTRDGQPLSKSVSRDAPPAPDPTSGPPTVSARKVSVAAVAPPPAPTEEELRSAFTPVYRSSGVARHGGPEDLKRRVERVKREHASK